MFVGMIIEEASLKFLQGHSEAVHEVVFLPDGSLASCSRDEKIKIWNLDSGEEIGELNGHTKPVYSICLLQRDMLASGSGDTTIKIWNWKERKLVRTLNGHTRLLCSIRSLKNDRLASYSSDDTIKIWNPYLEANNLLITMSGHGNKGFLIPIGVLSNDYLVTCSSNDSENATLRVWNPNDGELIKSIETQFNCPFSLLLVS